MSVVAISLKAHVDQIIREIRQEGQAVLDSRRDDLHKSYQPLLKLPDAPTYSLSEIYSLSVKRMESLLRNRTLFQFTGAIGSFTTTQTKKKRLEKVNAETKLIEIVAAATSQIYMSDSQKVAIKGLFEQIADSLRSFSLDVVGVIVRYAM